MPTSITTIPQIIEDLQVELFEVSYDFFSMSDLRSTWSHSHDHDDFFLQRDYHSRISRIRSAKSWHGTIKSWFWSELLITWCLASFLRIEHDSTEPEKVLVCGLVNFVPAVTYLICHNLPAAFSQPRAKTFFGLCKLGKGLSLWQIKPSRVLFLFTPWRNYFCHWMVYTRWYQT